MNKWQVLCPLAVIAIAVIAFTMVSGSNHHRYYVRAQTRMIGRELLAATNSVRLVPTDPGFRKRLSEFLSSRAGVAEVVLGDAPSPIGDGTACSRLILSNATGGRLGIRLRQDSEPERFHVLGVWTVPESAGQAN